MTPQELRAAGRLSTQVYAATVAHIEKAHRRIAATAFRPAAAAGAPAHAVHDSIARFAYGTVRGVGSALGDVASDALPAVGFGSPRRPAGSTPGSNLALAALNAAVGDKLADDDNPLAIRMAVRSRGRDLPLSAAALGRTFAPATPKLAVFLHGLGETDESWRLNSGRDATTYGSRLAGDLGYTPVYLRYNTGRHISDNGEDLSHLLTELVSHWPAGVDEVALLGHSMGGLVARSACHHGEAAAQPWVAKVRHLVLLGSPNLGAPLARWANYAGWALSQTRKPLPFATLMTSRSGGIDDLRYGYLVKDDWLDCDSNACRKNHRHDIPLLATANHYVISATVARSPDSPLGQVMGDLLVQPASATGRRRARRHISFSADNVHTFAGLHHFQLLNHPAVYRALRNCLQSRDELSPL